MFSLFSLLPGTPYTVAVQAEGETLTLDFTTEAETFFVDASRYGLVADGTTDNTGKLQAALSTCPKGGTVYVPAGRYRTLRISLGKAEGKNWWCVMYPNMCFRDNTYEVVGEDEKEQMYQVFTLYQYKKLIESEDKQIRFRYL